MSALALLLAAAEGGQTVHKDETPFYVAGILLAVFAVLVSVAGIRRPAATRLAGPAMGLGALLVVATMTAVIVVS